MKVYVVISSSIVNNHESNGLHGVYTTKSDAKNTAISAIKSIAQHYYHNVNTADICADDLEFSYQEGSIDIFVSCIEQELR